MDPLLVVICLDHQLSGLTAFKESGKFGVNILAEDQKDLADHFARAERIVPKGPYVTGKTGVPCWKESWPEWNVRSHPVSGRGSPPRLG